MVAQKECVVFLWSFWVSSNFQPAIGPLHNKQEGGKTTIFWCWWVFPKIIWQPIWGKRELNDVNRTTRYNVTIANWWRKLAHIHMRNTPQPNSGNFLRRNLNFTQIHTYIKIFSDRKLNCIVNNCWPNKMWQWWINNVDWEIIHSRSFGWDIRALKRWQSNWQQIGWRWSDYGESERIRFGGR
jgi:hypothetical protein